MHCHRLASRLRSGRAEQILCIIELRLHFRYRLNISRFLHFIRDTQLFYRECPYCFLSLLFSHFFIADEAPSQEANSPTMAAA